jgi:hypothetical protein
VTETTIERSALFGPFRLFPAQQLLPEGKNPFGRQSGPGNPTRRERIPPSDLALPHSTGAKP